MTISLAKYFILTLTIIAGVFIGTTQSASAAFGIPASGVELSRYAWSGYTHPVTGGREGIGWISMNCSNTDTCVGGSGAGPKVDYAVRLETNGNLTGYAWASNGSHPVTGAPLGIGWIDFNPAGPYPSGAGVANQSARRVSGTFPDVTFGGWARACGVFVNPSACSGALSPEAGGWDGWIALSGSSAGGYGVTMSAAGAAAGSYAWGGPTVAGWISFSPPGDPVAYDVTPPVVTFNCPPSSIIAPGGSVDCTYTVVPDPVAPVDSCTLTNDLGSSQSVSVSGGNLTLSPAESTTYSLTCTGGGVPSTPVTQSIEVRPDILLRNPQVILGPQNPATGVYNWVDIRYRVLSLPAGQAIPYRIELASQTPGTGTITGTGAVITSTHRFTNVPYSATPAAYVIEADDSPAQGAVHENIPSTPANEDINRIASSTQLAAPNPVITVDLPEFVRSGEPADVEVTVTAIYDTTCQVFGPGFTTPTSQFTVTAGTPYTNTFTTAQLTNATNIAVRCAVVGGPDYSVDGSVEVIPAFQEV